MTFTPLKQSAVAAALPRHALVLVGLVVMLWGFSIFARTLPTLAILGVWLLLAAVMVESLLPRRRLRRRIWLNACLRSASVWHGRLRGGLVMGAFQWLKALLLSALLLGVLVRADDPSQWRLLMVGALLLVLIRAWFHRGLMGDLNPGFRPEPVWRASLWCAGAVLVALLAVLALLRAQPDFTEASLAQAVWHQIDQEVARSAFLQEALRILAAKEGLQFWLGQHVSGLPLAGGPVVVVVWLLIFLEQGLFAAALMILFSGALSRLPPDALLGHHAG